MNKSIRQTSIVTFALALLLLAGGAMQMRSARAAQPTQGRQAQVSPERLLPGDSAIGNAGFSQENPQIAAGGGGYLAVWEDWRTDFAGVPDNYLASGGDFTGQLLKDIYAVRLDSNGQPIDATPIVVAQATWSQSAPQVAWNGQNWLVVWNSQRQANFSYTTDVMAARVSPQGQVLDIPSIVVDGNPTIDELWPTVASDGQNWVVIWMDQGNYFELDATRISPAGVVMDPGGVAILTPSFPDAPYNAAVTFAGDEYFLAWSGDNKIKAMRLTTNLQRIGSVFIVSQFGNFPEVASDGTDFFVAWQYDSSVYGSRVTHGGQVLDPSGINISGQNGGYPLPDVSWDGTNWWVTWVPYSDNAMAARVSPGGTLLDPNGIIVSGSARQSAIAGQQGGGARVVWTDYHLGGLGRYDIYGAAVSAGGTPGQASPISLGAPAQVRSDLAANGSQYLAVYMSVVSGETRIKGQRLDNAGNPLDAEPFLIAGGSQTFTKPRVAWNGSIYLVVWEDSSLCRGFVCGAILGKRVDANGNVLDATATEYLPGNEPDVAALNGTFLVVDTYEQINHQRFPQAVRVDGNGQIVGTRAGIGSIYAVRIKVEAIGSRWLAVWQDHPTHDNPRSVITGAFVNPDGTGAGEFLIASNGLLPSKAPDVTPGSNQGLITFFSSQAGDVTQGDIYAKRITPEGALLDGGLGIQVTSADNAQYFSSAAWTGSEYVIAYEDHRNVPYLDRPESDVYASRMDASGVMLDPNGFAISDDFVPEVSPVVAAQNGGYLILFSNFKYAAPYAAYRLDVRSGQAGGQPTPEPIQPTTTPSPTQPVYVPGNYIVTQSSGATIVPGTTDSGNHCDECATEITLPFAYTLYDQTFNTVEATANGTLNFVDSGRTGGINFCLPYSGLGYSILPHWDDLMTVGSGDGIFTSVSGSAPNRIFNIEWRACDWGGGGNCGSQTFNFEVRLYEGQQRFDFIYGQISGNGNSATVGVQKDTGQRYTQYECNTGGLSVGQQLTFVFDNGGSVTPGPSSTPFPTVTPIATSTPVVPTNTTVPGATNTPAVPTNTTVPGATNTPVGPTATATVGACNISFSDVPPGATFYDFVQCLACRNVLGGYADGTFRPGNGVTRGQLSKIVSNAAGWNDIPAGQTFEDVPTDHTFYLYVERMASRGIIGGYVCGGPGEPCGAENRPYFRPNNPATRGQISKIVSESRGYNDPVGSQTFEDVPPAQTFYEYIERLAMHGVMSGYPCGGPGEPCGTGNKSYFRPGNNATRGQLAKIVSNTFFPNCQP